MPTGEILVDKKASCVHPQAPDSTEASGYEARSERVQGHFIVWKKILELSLLSGR